MLLSSSPTGVEIGLEQGTYSVDESDGVVQVCAVIVSGELEDTVAEVMIITQSGTALDSGTCTTTSKPSGSCMRASCWICSLCSLLFLFLCFLFCM